MLEYLRRLTWDPTAPVPAGWPRGWWGALLLFCVPGGFGIPPGVLLGHHDGLGPTLLTVLYVLSDVILAFFFEPMLLAFAFAARAEPRLRRLARALVAAIARSVEVGTASTATAVVLTGFAAGLPFGRALGRAAGQTLVPSWMLAITGDTLCFLLAMVSTLWLDRLIGDQRVTVLAAFAVMVTATALVRRVRARLG
jgi:hypothetical protein